MNGTRLNWSLPPAAARLLFAALAAVLLLADTAAAEPPVLDKVEYKANALRVSWTLPPGAKSSSFYGSRSPKLDRDGSLDELDIYVNLGRNVTRITYRQRYEKKYQLYTLEPGRYYVQVQSINPGCGGGCPLFEYSRVRSVVVTDGFRKDANLTCKTYIPFARKHEREARKARTPKQWAKAIELIVAEIRAMNSDLRDNPTPPRAAKRVKFKAMLKANLRSARYGQRAARAARGGKPNRAIAALRKAVKQEGIGERYAKRLGLPACVQV